MQSRATKMLRITRGGSRTIRAERCGSRRSFLVRGRKTFASVSDYYRRDTLGRSTEESPRVRRVSMHSQGSKVKVYPPQRVIIGLKLIVILVLVTAPRTKSCECLSREKRKNRRFFIRFSWKETTGSFSVCEVSRDDWFRDFRDVILAVDKREVLPKKMNDDFYRNNNVILSKYPCYI